MAARSPFKRIFCRPDGFRLRGAGIPWSHRAGDGCCGGRLAFDLDNMMLNLVANDHYDEGEEVTFYYGKHCTEEFIVHYGFDTGNSRSCEKMKRELSVSIWENPI